MAADRVPQVGEVWQFRLFPERLRERGRVRIVAVDLNGDAVAFAYLRSGTMNGSQLIGFLRVYEFVEAAPVDVDEAVSA